jgi:hypothetical protein
MACYRKKPVIIEAVKVSEIIEDTWDGEAMPDWAQKAVDAARADASTPGALQVFNDHIEIKTLEGTMRGEYDDYLICGIQGELYPCKSAIFERTYEAVP